MDHSRLSKHDGRLLVEGFSLVLEKYPLLLTRREAVGSYQGNQTQPIGGTAMYRIATAALFAAGLVSSARAAEPGDMLEKASSRYASLDKYRVHYKSFGEGKTAVIFIH